MAKFYKIVDSALEEEKLGESRHPDKLMSFTGSISQVRAFVFTLMAGNYNSSKVSSNNMLAGLNRFGIENPAPVVSTRCGLYGNSRSVMEILEDAEEKFGKGEVHLNSGIYQGGS